MKKLNDEWLRYRNTVYHGEVLQEEQHKQLYMAFWAGALACFGALHTMAKDKHLTDDERAKQAEALRDEIFKACDDFIETESN